MKRLLYPERNRLFLALSMIMLAAVIVIARYSTWPAIPGFGFLAGPIPDDGIPYDMAMGYLASYIFYFIQVYLPQRSRENKALKAVELYLRAYLRNAALLYAVLQDYDFAKLPECADKIPAYSYKNSDGESFAERFELIGGRDSGSGLAADGIYCFLLKAKNIYEQMAGNQAFSSLDAFLLDQIQAMNMPYWFETYEKILVLKKEGYGDEIKPFRNDAQQMEFIEKLKMAMDRIEEYLGVQSAVERIKA